MVMGLALGFGVMIGLLLGAVGGGGSILTVPILVYVLGQGVHEATATSLAIVGTTALIGAIVQSRAGRVDARTALTFGGAGIGGAFGGTWLNARVSGPAILLLFGVLMLFVALRMAMRKRSADTSPVPTVAVGFHWPVLVSGLVVGVMTGFFGVGGGFLIVPALVLILHMPMRLAVGTSLLVIAINSAAGLVAHLGSGGIDASLAALFVAGGFAGTVLGGRLAGRIDEARLARGFAALVALVGVFLIARNGSALL
jgi:uncharacterized membrane protein YfcA